jgi:hypothetical protein
MMIVRDLDKVFTYPVEDGAINAIAESSLVTQRDFSITKGAARQVMFEIFFDPQFYLLEIFVESRDAGETKSSF